MFSVSRFGGLGGEASGVVILDYTSQALKP